ncbi:hypothetical protein CcI49_18585 [Frankia sp. CcI49]|nr:hypothetical protein CcI49_18585 [Frankia sp. CcI49]
MPARADPDLAGPDRADPDRAVGGRRRAGPSAGGHAPLAAPPPDDGTSTATFPPGSPRAASP